MSQPGYSRRLDDVNRSAIGRWMRRRGIVGDDGQPMKLHRSRIRTTHHAMRDQKSWTGNARAAIDPNHTPAVEGDHYLSATTPGQRHAVETIIEDAQHDILRRAHPPTVITEEEAAALAEGYPQLLTMMKLDDGALAELVGGARDVFTAACADQLAGLHGPAGKPCPARPWICLLCPLAVFAPRHAVNLLRLKAFFSRQWQQMPAAQRIHNENRIRAAMDRLLRGEIPPGGSCDIKTLAREADVDRTAFYGTRPYAHLRTEFEHRLQQLRHAGQTPDPKTAQIERLKAEVDKLRTSLAQAHSTIEELADFRTQALARLAAQHDEILRLRTAAAPNANVARIPAANRQKVIGPC